MSKYLLYFNEETGGNLLTDGTGPEWYCYFFIFLKFSKTWNLNGRIRWSHLWDWNPKKSSRIRWDDFMKPDVSNGIKSMQFSILGLMYFVRDERRWGSRKPSHADCSILSYHSMHTDNKLERYVSIRRGVRISLVF